MTRYLITLFILLMFFQTTWSQHILTEEEMKDSTKLLKSQLVSVEINGKDTILRVFIPEITIIPKREFKSEQERKQYERLVYNVKKVYPYAVLIRQAYADIEKELEKMNNKRDQKKYLKEREDKLREQFEKQLIDLSITQGRILIKLVDRETGNTTYDVIKEFKGSLSALFWQSIASMFGSNLKSEYEGEGEDKMIEEIIVQIENGQI